MGANREKEKGRQSVSGHSDAADAGRGLPLFSGSLHGDGAAEHGAALRGGPAPPAGHDL